MAKAKLNNESRIMYLARALYDAVEDSNIQQVNILLTQNKANPNILIPEEEMTAFHLAAGHENLAFGKIATSLFLHNGGDPNVRCEGNRTVLHIAVAWNRSSVVEILLKSPYITPDLYIKDDDDLNVFNYAVKFNSWESLAIIQCHLKLSSNSDKKISLIQSNYIEEKDNIFKREQETEKSICVESTINKSDKLHTSSGYFNSGESLNNTTKSEKCDLVSQKNILNESIISKTSSSSSDILNKNISLDYSCTELFNDIASSVSFDESMIKDFKCLDDISLSSQNSFVDSDSLSHDEIESIDYDVIEPKNMYSSNNELMTDISKLSSYLGSEEYFTCPDINSDRHILKNKTDEIDVQLEDITNNDAMTSFYDLTRSISKISVGTSDLKDLNLSSSDENISIVTDIIEDYDTDYVRQSLRKYGHPPGPIVSSTKRSYVRKLNRILKNQSEINHDNNDIKVESKGSYSFELTKVLNINEYGTWKNTIKSWSYLEESIINKKSGSSFTYLLLDPRITKNLPARADQINPIEVWQIFISSIFYIGKGTKGRPNDHMSEAFNFWIKNSNKELSNKTQYILNLWKNNMGVVCVQAFHHLLMKEALVREAVMIDAIGLEKLTNEKRGTYLDNTVRWKNSDRCKLGCYLLYRAMLVFLADGERQLQPIDLT